MKIGIVGCAGRVGRMLVRTVLETDGTDLAGGSEKPGSDVLGQDPGVLAGWDITGHAVSADSQALFEASDAIIDFTLPGAAIGHADLAATTGTALIIGTTGLGPDQQAALDAASQKTVIIQAANFSLGINVLLGLTKQVAGILGDDFDIEIVEMHHRHKVDAPSGTALALGHAAAAGRRVDLTARAQKVRDGHTGERRPGDIGFATLRGGDVVGEHTVMFAGSLERIELTHKADDRGIFARGAVRAALWSVDQPPGLYGMDDVLGLG